MELAEALRLCHANPTQSLTAIAVIVDAAERTVKAEADLKLALLEHKDPALLAAAIQLLEVIVERDTALATEERRGELLQSLMWTGTRNGEPCCIGCRRFKSQGHTDICAIAAELDAMEEDNA